MKQKANLSHSPDRKIGLLGIEYMKANNSQNDFVHLIRDGNSKHISEDLQQKAMRVLKSNKCYHDNLSQFSGDQIDEFYKQVVQKLTLEDHQGTKLIDPQITKSLYIVLFGEVIIYAPKLNDEEQNNNAESDQNNPADEKQIKSLLNLNLQDEQGNHHKLKSNAKASFSNQLNSQDEIMLKSYEFHKKLISGQVFGDVKQIPELPKRHLAKLVGEVILVKVQKKEMENILRTNMKELYFKVNQLTKLLPNVNNKSILQLSKQLIQKMYVKGQIIYSEGSMSDGIYFIKEGQVTFIKKYISEEKSDSVLSEANTQISDSQYEGTPKQLRKFKINQKEIELSKIGVGQVFGNDEVFLEIPRQMTTKVSSVNLEVYILNKDLLFQFLQKMNTNQQENGKSYLESLKKNSLNKQGFYENRLNANTKKIQNIVELQRKISSPQYQRGMSSITNDLADSAQQSPQNSQQLDIQAYSSLRKYPSKLSVHDKQNQSGGSSPQNSIQNLMQIDITHKSIHQEYLTPVIQREFSFKQPYKKEEIILTRPHSHSQTDEIYVNKQKEESEFTQLRNIKKTSADLNNLSLNNQSSNNSSLKKQELSNQANQSTKCSKQLAATDEIQNIVQNNYKFMVQSNAGKKFGFENPLFHEMDQNYLSRIRKINSDYQKMKNPKKYKEQPLYKQNQTAQKLISNILTLTKNTSFNLQNQVQDQNHTNNVNQSNIQIQSLVGSPRQSENSYKLQSNFSYNNDTIINQNISDSPNNSVLSKQTNKINIKNFHKSKFQLQNGSPFNKFINCNVDNPIQVNRLVSSVKEIPCNTSYKKNSYANSPILSPQSTQQNQEAYLIMQTSRVGLQQNDTSDKQQNPIFQSQQSNYNFNTTVQTINVDEKDKLIDQYQNKLEPIKFGNSINQSTIQSAKLIDYSIEQNSIYNRSFNLSKNKIDSNEYNQEQMSEQTFPKSIQNKQKLAFIPLKIKIPSSNDVQEQQKGEISSSTQNNQVYYFKQPIKASPRQIKNMPLNLSINGKIPLNEIPVDHLNKSRGGTTNNTPVNHDKSSSTFMQDNNQLQNPINFFQSTSTTKSQSLGRRTYNQKCNNKAVFNCTLQSIIPKQPFEKQMNQINSLNNQNNSYSQQNSATCISQQEKQCLIDNQNTEISQAQTIQESATNQQSPYSLTHAAFFNNFSQTPQSKKEYLFIQSLPQNNLIFQKKSSQNIGENLNYSISTSNQILQHPQLFTNQSYKQNKQDKNFKSIKEKPIFDEKSKSPQKDQYINFHTNHKTQSKSSSRVNHQASPNSLNPNISSNCQAFIYNPFSPKLSEQKERFKAIQQPN